MIPATTLLLLLAPTAGAAGAETLGDLLTVHGLTPPTGTVPDLDRALRDRHVLEDDAGLLIVYALGEREAAPLHARRFDRASQAWKTATLDWSRGTRGPLLKSMVQVDETYIGPRVYGQQVIVAMYLYIDRLDSTSTISGIFRGGP